MIVTVFDLDDTLYPEYEYAQSGLKHVGSWLEDQHSCKGITRAFLEILAKGTRGTIFNEVLPRFGLSLELIPQLVKLYREHLPKIKLKPEVLHILERSRHLGKTALMYPYEKGTVLKNEKIPPNWMPRTIQEIGGRDGKKAQVTRLLAEPGGRV